MQTNNALITGTMLGSEDHGIMTCYLYLEWEGAGIGFGGYVLDSWDEKKGKRVGHGSGMDFIRRIMEVAGVEKWEDLKGKYVRVTTEGWGGKAICIGNLMKEEWLYPEEFFKNYE